MTKAPNSSMSSSLFSLLDLCCCNIRCLLFSAFFSFLVNFLFLFLFFWPFTFDHSPLPPLYAHCLQTHPISFPSNQLWLKLDSEREKALVESQTPRSDNSGVDSNQNSNSPNQSVVEGSITEVADNVAAGPAADDSK